MNQQHLKNYQHTPSETSPREVESWALLASADALLDAKNNPHDLETARAALRSNLVLWTIFQAAVLEPENQLPHEIKVNILNLSRFVDKHTFSLFADFKPEKVNILIDINRNIAAGLVAKPEETGIGTSGGTLEAGTADNDSAKQAPATPRPSTSQPASPSSQPTLGDGRAIEA